MIPNQTATGRTVTLSTDFDTAVSRTIEALKGEGFGVLTQIDAKETLKTKLDIDFHPYLILGACNPPLAHRALTAAPEVGLLLPCNVTVAQVKKDRVAVSIIDPMAMLSVIDHPALEGIAAEAAEMLDRVAAALQEA